MRLHYCFSILLLAASVAPAQTKPTQSTLSDLEELNNQVANLPQIKADSINQLVKFSIEQNMLAAQTSLNSVDGLAHVILPDLRGVIQMTSFRHVDPDPPGKSFQIDQRDFSNPAIGEVQTTLMTVGGRLIISRSSEALTIQYVQDPPPPPDGEVRDLPVKLFINRTDPIDSTKDMKLHFAAEDFLQLRRGYASEVDRYFRPIIRDYKQEAAVFAIEPAIAWQVLGKGFTPDNKIGTRVNALVPKLGADDFRQREDAMRELKQLGPQAANVLAKIDRNKLTLQQCSAIDSLLAEMAPLTTEQIKQFADDKSFLLDVLFNDDSALRQLALERLQNLVGKKIELSGGESAIVKLRAELIPTTQP